MDLKVWWWGALLIIDKVGGFLKAVLPKEFNENGFLVRLYVSVMLGRVIPHVTFLTKRC